MVRKIFGIFICSLLLGIVALVLPVSAAEEATVLIYGSYLDPLGNVVPETGMAVYPKTFETIEDALAETQNPDPEICLVFNADSSTHIRVVVNGQHTLTDDLDLSPYAYVDLVIPYYSSTTDYGAVDDTTMVASGKPSPTAFTSLTNKLIIPEGITLSVGANNSLINNAQQTSQNPRAACVTGNYGGIVNNGTIDVYGKWYARGYVIGSGDAVIRSGAILCQPMQTIDWRGGTASVAAMNGTSANKAFPFNTFNLCTVTCKTEYEYGSRLQGIFTVEISDTKFFEFAEVLASSSGGTNAIFLMESGSKVYSYYDFDKNRMVYDLYGNVNLGGTSVTVKVVFNVTIDTTKMVLPICDTFCVNIKNGSKVKVQYATKMLPGSTVNIEAGGELILSAPLYLYRAGEYRTGYTCSSLLGEKLSVPGVFITGSAKLANNGILPNAALNVAGTVTISGGGIYQSTNQYYDWEYSGSSPLGSWKPTGCTKWLLHSHSNSCAKIVTTDAGTGNCVHMIGGNIAGSNVTSDNAIWEFVSVSDAACVVFSPLNSYCTASHIETESTCSLSGVSAYYCTGSCGGGASYISSYQSGYNGVTQWTKIVGFLAQKPLEHTYGDAVHTDADCVNNGYDTYTCTACDGKETHTCIHCTHNGHTNTNTPPLAGRYSVESTTDLAKGHTEVTDAAVAPTCTDTGLTEGCHCSVCSEVLTAQKTVAALGHTEVTDAAVAPTCTDTGLTEGCHCSVCSEVLTAQKTVAALGHTEVTDAAVDPTCIHTGLTQGYHCSVCGVVTTPQLEIPIDTTETGHNYTTEEITVPPTCTSAGIKKLSCAWCDEFTENHEKTESIEIDPDAHCYGEVTITTSATCIQAGKTSCSCIYCSDTKEENIGYKIDEHGTHTQKTITVPGAHLTYTVTYCDGCQNITSVTEATGKTVVDPGSIFTASLTLKNSISLNFYVTKTGVETWLTESGLTDAYFSVVKFDKTWGVQRELYLPMTDWVVDGSQYRISFPKITALELTDDFVFCLVAKDANGNTVISPVKAYKIENYAYQTLSGTDEKLKTLMADLLNFGYQAQTYVGTMDGVNYAEGCYLPRLIALYQTGESELSLSSVTKKEGSAGTASIKSASVYVAENVYPVFFIEVKAGVDPSSLKMKVKIEGLDTWLECSYYGEMTASNGNTRYGYMLKNENITPITMRKTLTVAVFAGETQVSETLTYSIESYAKSVSNNASQSAAMKALAEAMMRYGDAAIEYNKTQES